MTNSIAVPTAWYHELVQQIAGEKGLDPLLVEAFIWQESSGRAYAYKFEQRFYDHYLKDNPRYAREVPARVGASYGLMQVMYSTAVEHGFEDEPEMLFVPSVNIDVGTTILKKLLNWAAPDLKKALAAYNGGRGNFAGTAPQLYAMAVQRKYDILKHDGGVNA